jgi:hypothetical protein
MRWRLVMFVFLLLLPQTLLADLEVQATGGHVTIRARAVSLARVLEQLGKQTGMQVVYEAAPPSQLVSASVEADSPREALTRILEGLGVSYAFRMDRSGTRVEMLLITGAAGGSSPGAGGSSVVTRRPVMPQPVENPEGFEEGFPEGFAPEEGQPGQPFEAPELVPPGGFPPNMPMPEVPQREPPQGLPRPEFPKGASYPSSPP